jgi:hypothetical protein
MKWEQFQMMLCDQGKADVANLMHNRLAMMHTSPNSCTVEEEQEIGGKRYVVVQTPQMRRLFWEERIERWITPRQVDPAGALQKRLALEKQLGILAVLPLAGNSMVTQGDLYQILLNVSPVTVTRAHQLLSTELDARGRPEFEWVALVTVECLTTDEIRQWEAACREIVQEDEDQAA